MRSRLARWANYLEPARARALVGAIMGVLTALGIITTADLPGWADVLLAVWAMAAPIVQGELIRARVWSPASVDRVTRESGTA